MAGIFKAYDVRGTYPDQVNEAIAEKIGLAVRTALDPEAIAAKPMVVVSRDMRSHSEPLLRSLVAGIRASGLDVLDIGLATTPTNYFAVGHLGAAGGVQVTASHNPARYNGFKFSRHGARPVSGDEGIPGIEKHVHAGDLRPAAKPGALDHGDVFAAYSAHVLSFLESPPPGSRRLKVVVDAANGMGTLYRPLLEAAGIDLELLYFELDGTFPNHEANPLKRENLLDLAAAVRRHGADLGVAFDGDADRAAFVDETGEPVGSDLATALIAGELLAHHPGKHVVYDLRSSRAVAEYIAEKGGIPIRERVGHSFIKATMRQHDGLFGGELAGHYYFRDNYFADCSILAVFEILNLLRRTGKTMSETVLPLRRYAKSEEINFEVEDKQGKMDELARRFSDATIDYLDGVTFAYPTWWANVRPSNTEPYLRLVLEAQTADELASRQAELIGLLGHPAE